MATNPFGFGPRGLPAKEPASPESIKASIDDLAVKTQVPANILIAFAERGDDPAAKAKEISGWVSGGRKVEEVVPPDVMNRAYDIADALYPREAATLPAKDQPGIAGNIGRLVGGGVVKGIGQVVRGLGAAGDVMANAGAGLSDPKDGSMVSRGLNAAGEEISNYGTSIGDTISDSGKVARQGFDPSVGDITKPWTWSLGPNPSIEGAVYAAADVFGSFLPVVATAVVGGPLAGAAVGGPQGGGAAADAARKTIMEMAATKRPDGTSELEAQSSVYRGFIEAGMSPEEALRRTSQQAEQLAFLMATPISAFGGAVTGKILHPGISALAGKGLAARVAGTGAASALEEGAQEVAESIATKAGINYGAGTDLSLTEGTFGDFILGAMGGGPVGAVSGAFNKETRDDGSVAGQAGAPASIPPGGMGAPVTNTSGVAAPGAEGGAAVGQLPTPPAGPLRQIADSAPDLTPVEPPAPRFPDFKPGKDVALVDPETGVIHNAVFIAETPNGVAVRIDGGEVELDPQTFDQARVAAIKAAEGEKPKKKGGKNAATAADAPADLSPVPPEKPYESGFDAPAQAIVDMGGVGIPETPPGPVRAADTPAMTPDEALKRAKIIEDTAKRGGWNARLKKKHAEFMAIAGGANAQGQETADDVGAGNPGDGGKLPDLREGGQGTQEVVRDGRPATNASGQSVQSDMVSDGDAAGGSPAVAGAVYGDDARNDITLTLREIMDSALANGERGNIAGASVSRIDFEFLKAGSDAFLDGKASAPRVPSREGQILADFGFNKAKQQVEALGYKPVEAKPKVAPITTPPDARIQPDMLGGAATTETEMAAKERRRKEWGRFLGIVENGKSMDDSTLEGRDVLIRGTRVIIRAKLGAPSDLDMRLDTGGMDRDTIAARVRGALNELDRRAPLPVPVPTQAPIAQQTEITGQPPATDAPSTQDRRTSDAPPTQQALETDQVVLKDSGKGRLGRVSVSRHADGWHASYDYDVPGYAGGGGSAQGGPFQTKDAAIKAGKAAISRMVADIADGRSGSAATDAHIAKAKRILKWAGVDDAPETPTKARGKSDRPSGAAPAEKLAVDQGKAKDAVRDAYRAAQAAGDEAGVKKFGIDFRTAVSAAFADEAASYVASKAKPATGLLSVLSAEKQARAAELAKKLADKARNQTSSGLDPEYITLGGELVKLYLEAGVKKFGQMLRDFAAQTGLTLKQAQEPMRAAYNHVRDNMEIEGESIDGMDDARAVLEEAKKAIQGDTPPPPTPKPRDPVSANPNPTGQTYRLENALTTAERRIIATARDQGAYVGEVFAELDNASRRAEADMRSRGVDIAQADDIGNINGKPDQMAWFIREAEAHAKELVKQVKAEGAENVGPLDKDEDTGEWEYDGSALGNALEFLDQQYAMGLGVDEDVIPGPGGGNATAMNPEKVFPAPKGTRNIDSLVEQEGFIRKVEADARLAFWKKTAARIGKEGKNADKVIVSLFDYKGTWSQPWVDAGYTVIRHDIKTGSDLITDQWIYDRITEIREDGKEVYGVLSACPCTTFTGSGARWWQERHDVESPEALAQVFGDRAVSSGAKSALEYNVMLADATREAVRLANPTGFHVLENPIGRIQDKAKFPAPLARFHPHNFGDPYTKRTQLFGDFQADLPTANVQPVEGSKMQNSLRGSDPLGKEDRSTTPEGFAYAFFMANDPDARKVKDNTGTISGAVDRLSGDAVKGGDETSPPLSVEPAPVPQSAPWWDTADDLTRRAILKEAGLFQGADVADRFSAMSEGLRGKLTDAFGRLYRAKKIDNIGTTEAPRFALAGETIDATAVPTAAKASGRLEIIDTRPKAAPEIDGSAFEAVGMVRGNGASSDSWFRKQRETGGIASYKVRSVASGWKVTRDFTPDTVTAPPTRELGTFSTPAEAIAQLKENGMRTGVPEEPAAPAKTSSEKTWKDFDESSATDPKMPAGYELTAIRRLTRDEARSEGYQWPAMKAVVKRDRPYTYKVESAISEKSRSDAIAQALRLAQKGAPGADGVIDLPPTPTATSKDAEEFWDSLTMNARGMLAEEGGLDRFDTQKRRWYALSDDEKVAIARGRLKIKTPALTKDAEEMWTAVIGDHSKPAPAPVVIEGTATVESTDTNDPMQVEVTKEGPWDFNDTFPAPDAEQVGRLVVEGRSPFDAETPEEVVSILTETMAEAEQHATAIEAWSAEIEKINAGEKPGFAVPKGKSAIDVATENLAAAVQALDDTIGAVQDVWGEQAAKAFKAEAERRVNRERITNPPAPDKTLPTATPFTDLPDSEAVLPPPDAQRQEFSDYIASVLGAKKWAIISPKHRNAGRYGAHITQAKYDEIKAQYDAGRTPPFAVTANADTTDNAPGTKVDWQDWWENGVVPTSRPSELVRTGSFTPEEAEVGRKSWSDLSSAERARVSGALASHREKVVAEQREIDARSRTERERKKAAKDAQDAKDADDRLKQSIGRIDELKGGTPRSVVEWGKPLGLRDDAGFVGHGYMVLRKGVVPAFDAIIAAETIVPGSKQTEAGMKRLAETASGANLQIDWRFVRNAQEKAGAPFKPFSVAGKVQDSNGPRWVEIDQRLYSFLSRHGLQALAGPNDAIVSIRRPDGEMVGFGSSIRPWNTLDEMDAVANPPEPETKAAGSDVEAEQPEANADAPGQTDDMDANDPAAKDEQEKPQTGKIDDFGEKIGGARKDVWSGFKDRLREAEALDASAEPLSKSWPEPDYEKLIEAGVDPWTVGFIRAARDHIPRKPLKSWKLKGWVQGVETLRKFSVDLMDGKIGADEVRDHLAKSQTLKSEVANIIDLYMEVGHGKSLKGLRFHESSYSMLNGVSYKPHRVVWEIERDQAPRAWNTMSRVVVRADTKAEAIDQFKAIHAKMDESGAKRGSRDKNTKFLIYSQRTGEDRTYRIGVKIGRNYVDLRNGITDVKEARRIVADEAEQLQAQLDAMKNVPDVRSDENAPRIGVDHRNGADVTPQQFAETFGFRGVEFGNWVEQGRRQKDLNDAYDALMDLAAIVDIPPRAISLNGALGLAFGARGSGGKNAAAAHYEPGKMVINLTKKQGQGSLAHEWFHALDNHFARKREPKRGSWITDNSSPGGQFTAGVRPEVVDAFLEVKRAIAKTGMKERTQRLDKMRSDPYWSTGIEMHARAFESYVIGKLHDQNASNDYLANVVNGIAYQMQAELAGLGDSYPYLKPEELEVVRPAFDALFATIETRETDAGLDLEMREAPTVADLRGDELGDWSDIRELGRKAETWYRENLVGSSVLNVAAGMNIEFNARGAKKIRGGKGQDLYSSVVALREILADGRLIESAPDRLGRRQIKAVHKIAATISISGRRVDVVATVREKDDGTFHYDLGMDREAGGFAAPTAETEARASALDGDLADLNLDLLAPDAKSPVGWSEVAADPEITEADIMAITRDLNAELGRTGLAGKVNVRVVRDLYSRVSGSPIMGRADSTGITVRAGTQVGDIGVMRHEIIHALRSEQIWNRKGGLFTEAEWSELTAAARAEPEIVASVRERYPNLGRPGQVEEMVAELYRLWMANRDSYSKIERALLKVEGFLAALANLLRGRGFVSAARVMEQIATGKIGGRGPQGPGGGRRQGGEVQVPPPSEMRGSAVRYDNPGGSWLAGKVERAEEAMRNAPKRSAAYRGITGPATAYTTAPVSLPVDFVAGLPGASGEKRGPGDPQYDALADAVRNEGWRGDDSPILIEVNHKGQAFITEGNTRAAIAQVNGIQTIKAEVKWLNGGEAAQGVLTPARLESMVGGAEMRGGALPGAIRSKFKGLVGSAHWKNPGEFVSNILTDAMAGKGDYSALALVPGRALFSELGKRLPSAKAYLRGKEEMDSLRNDWHAKADEVAQEWRKARRADSRANDDLMDLMHRSTLSGVDPSRPDTWKHAMGAAANEAISRHGESAPKWAFDVIGQIAAHERAYATLQERFNALPKEMQEIYRKTRAAYDKMGDDFERAVLDNIKASMAVAVKRAEKAHRKEMDRIRDEGLKGPEKDAAIKEADEKLAAVKKRGGWAAQAKVNALRKKFESNRLKGPYFPLARFGQYFVTIRNHKGEVVSFSRFEKEAQQQTFIREQQQAGAKSIQHGVLSDSAALKAQIDPTFVADIEMMLADSGASNDVMDAIWQRYLETLPDQSIRTSKIHRKGREGWNKDAFRAFGHHMFHGAHQLARLKYGLQLGEALNDAEDEAKVAEDPNRAGLIVNEMRKRHAFIMNPTGSSLVAGLSSLSFVWYLGATPAAAVANISQTTVVGPGIMAARFKAAGVTGALREIGRAMKDFGAGRGDTMKSPRITQDEHAALAEAYRRGTIDKTQAHDLASVAETGIEYNATREAFMRKIGWMFHHAERMNREVTFLANYRLARADGLRGEEAVDLAADLTWKIHFDYQNTSRPRFMQNDLGKLLTIFRQFTVNLAWRVFRDTHQMLRGATKEERAEARTQLVGLMLSMMAHAGIKGTYGYGLLMGLLAIFFPGDSDDIEEWLQDALLMEGDSMGVAAWNYTMGAALNGVPGQIIGADLTERIGSPNIWFRGPSSDLEGADLFNHYLTEFAGPPAGIVAGWFIGGQRILDGDFYRGAEAAMPKMVRDILKTGRYAAEGVETMKGDDILENVNPWELLLQANGFTPARVAERFDINTRLKNKEAEIMDERKGIHKGAVDAILSGHPIPADVMEEIRDFNRRFPEYPITSDTIRQSAQGRMRAQKNADHGVTLNPRISDRLREDLAPAIYE